MNNLNPNNKVDDFLQKLAAKTPKAKEESANKNRKLEKIYLNFPGNFGRYQILPMDSVVLDFPFVTLFNTREINIPRKNMSADGAESVYDAWIKLLPKDAYTMKDPSTGRVVSSLTAANEQLLNQAYMIFDQLFEELDARNNREPEITKLLRKRNYTIFHGYCINKWDLNDSRSPNRQNFCGLFVCTAKGFMNAIETSIEEKTLIDNDNTWIPSVYNRQLSGRDGFLMFSIAPNKLQAGYSVTVSHEVGRAKSLEGYVISEEDAELMMDPVQSFLGWQANKDEENPVQQKRLFNAKLIQEAITYMSQQLAAIRMAKETGLKIGEAISRTNAEVLATQVPTNTMGETTNDPILAQMSGTMNNNPNFGNVSERVINNNDQPFVTPPVAHIDPITSAPVDPGTTSSPNPFNSGFGQETPSAAPFKPSFGNGFNGGGQF